MKQRTTLLVLAAMTAMIFATANAWALSDECVAPTPSEDAPAEVIIGNVKVRVTVAPCTFDSELDPCYEWRFEILDAASDQQISFNQASVLVPDCCYGPITIDPAASSSDLNVYDPGEGEPTLGFGEFVMQALVARGQGVSNPFVIATNTAKASETTLLLNLKKPVVFEVPGPACTLRAPEEALPGTIPGLNTQVIQLGNDITMKVRRGPDGCRLDQSIPEAERVQFFYKCPTADCVTPCANNGDNGDGCLLAVTVQDVGENFVYCSGLSSCPECLEAQSGSPITYSYTVGGRTYKVCYDPATGEYCN